MDDSPVSDDAEEGLKSCFWEEFGCATADNDCSNEANGNENDARNTKSPWTEVLSMHCEGIIVRDVVLCAGSVGNHGGTRFENVQELNLKLPTP